jgi:hypothetical protein
MATTGKVSTNAVGLYVGGSMIALSTDLDWTLSLNEIPTSNNDSGQYEENEPGKAVIEFTVKGFVAYDSNYGEADLIDLALARTKSELKYGTESTGDKRLRCDAYLYNISETGSHDGKLTFSATFKSTGQIYHEEIT